MRKVIIFMILMLLAPPAVAGYDPSAAGTEEYLQSHVYPDIKELEAQYRFLLKDNIRQQGEIYELKKRVEDLEKLLQETKKDGK